MDALPIITALGGLSVTARKVGAPVSTVQYWQDKGRIPAWREAQIREALIADGLDPAAYLAPKEAA